MDLASQSWNIPLYSPDNAPDRVGRSHGNRFCQERTSPWIRLRVKNALLPAILTVRRHRLPVTTCKRAIVVRDIADTPIDISEGCTLFPTAGNTADGRQGAVFHSYVGAACTIGSLRHRLGMGGLQEHRAGDQERCKRTERDFHRC
jgi:hypothetical protein